MYRATCRDRAGTGYSVTRPRNLEISVLPLEPIKAVLFIALLVWLAMCLLAYWQAHRLRRHSRPTRGPWSGRTAPSCSRTSRSPMPPAPAPAPKPKGQPIITPARENASTCPPVCVQRTGRLAGKEAEPVGLSRRIETTAADLEQKQVADRNRFGLALKRACEENTDGNVPFGYRVLNGRLYRHAEERKLITLIRDLRKKGLSLWAICRHLQTKAACVRCGAPRHEDYKYCEHCLVAQRRAMIDSGYLEDSEERPSCIECGAPQYEDYEYCEECLLEKQPFCVECGAPRYEDYEYCEECLIKKQTLCVECGAPLHEDYKYCEDCLVAQRGARIREEDCLFLSCPDARHQWPESQESQGRDTQ